MQTHNFLRSLPRCLLSAALVAGITTTAGVFAVDGNPPGLFELDGNTVDVGATQGDDWDGLPGSSAAFTGILADKAPLTIYTQGGSKDIRDITEWRHTNGSVPDKDDITNAYASAYTVTAAQATAVHKAGDLIIYFGLDRFANNGDAFAGFWFFQDNVGLGPDKKFIGKHVGRNGNQRGDLLVLVEYPQGANAQPEIKVYEWDPLDADHDNVADNLDELYSSANAMCDGSGNKLACAITNGGNLLGEPDWSYTPKNGYAGIPFESFFEGGINVSALLGGDVPCFSAFLAETRSSRSETAQLKDFVLGDFDLCKIAVTKDCEAKVNQEGDSITVTFDGMVTNEGGLTLKDVTVTDDNGIGAPVLVFGPQDLAPGESKQYSSSYSTNVPSPISDTVTAVGHRGETTVSATAPAECGLLLESDLQVTKICDAVINAAGTGLDVSFSGTVTNVGDDMLKAVVVVDDGGTPLDSLDDQTFNLGDLAPKASANFNGTLSNVVSKVEGSLVISTDTVTASATGALTGSPVQRMKSATCNDTAEPDILVTKRCTGASINQAGTGIVASFAGTVTNDGNVKLTGVKVVDDSGTPGVPGDDQIFDLGDLAPGASANYSGSYGIEGFTSTDTVVASGTDVLTGATPTDSAFAVCAADTNPLIAIEKVCTDAPAFGQPILYEITVRNAGDVALFGVVVTDDNATPDTTDDQEFLLGDLAPKAMVSFGSSHTPALAGTYTNTAVAEATAADGAQVSEFATATCDVPPPPDFEGCTPGFWKNSPGSWADTPYSPSDAIDMAGLFVLPNGKINNDLGGDSLMEALNYGGGDDLVGAAQILLRAAVASLLNSAHDGVDFPRSTADVIKDVNLALATKNRADILDLASALDADNNLGCDLANDNSF